MQDDENTVDAQDVNQESDPSGEEVITVEVGEPGSEDQGADDKGEPVAISPAEYRHFKKWQKEKSQANVQNPPRPQQSQQVSPQLNVEETVLLANGMPEELLTELKAVAQARGIKSLLKAQSDPIFVAVKEKHEKDQKQRDASLPASRGAGSVRIQKSVDAPGLSREEHMAMTKEAMKRL